MPIIILIRNVFNASAAALAAALLNRESQLVLCPIEKKLTAEPLLHDALMDIAKSLNKILTCPKNSDSVMLLKVQSAMSRLQNAFKGKKKSNGPELAINQNSKQNKLNFMELQTASEAARKTAEIQAELEAERIVYRAKMEQRKRLEITEKITKAIERGAGNTRIEHLSDSSIVWLKQKGYQIEELQCEHKFRITWKQN